MPNLFFKNNGLPQHLTLPLAMIAIRSPKMSASSIKCVVRMIVRPSFFCFNKFHKPRRDTGSRPDVGSSKKTTAKITLASLVSRTSVRNERTSSITEQRDCNVKSSFHTATVALDEGVLFVFQLDVLWKVRFFDRSQWLSLEHTYSQTFGHVTFELTSRNATQLTKDQQVLSASEFIEQQVLLRAQTHVTADLVHLLRNVEAIDVPVARGRRIETGQNRHSGTLTGSVVTREG